MTEPDTTEDLMRLMKEALGPTPPPEERPTSVRDAMQDASRRVGRYWLVSHIQTGGMGSVYRAWDPELNRWVAIKFLKEFAGDATKAYFGREAHLAASLDHPNIAKIYEVGERPGQPPTPYIVMQFIDGETLEKAGPRMSHAEKVAAVRQVALAMRYAHEKGVIHRDLKPANVMIDKSGHVFVMDLGVAKRIDAGETHTVVGTPCYMAPEQARGEADTRSDLYGIGAILYELLTHQPPFLGGSTAEILAQVLGREPKRPTTLNWSISKDLEAVVLKCMEKDKERRYAYAGQILEDLDAYLAGNPLRHARRPTFAYVLSKKIRKQPILWSAGALMALALVAASGFGVYWLFRAKGEAQEKSRVEARGRKEAEEETRRTQEQLGRNYLLRATQAVEDGDEASAALLFAEALVLAPSPRARASSALAQRSLPRLSAILDVGKPAALLAASPDGGTIATEAFDGTVRFWNAKTSESVGRIELGDLSFVLIFSSDGATLATAESGRLRFWEVPSGRPKGKPIERGAPPPALSADLKRALVVGQDGALQLWDCETATSIATLVRERCSAFAIGPDGSLTAATSSQEGTLRVWNGRGQPVGDPRVHGALVDSIALHPDGKRIATAGIDGVVRIWNGEGIPLLHSSPVSQVHFVPDGLLAISAEGRMIHVWNADGGPLRKPIRCENALWGPTLSADGRWIAAPGAHDTVQLWEGADLWSIRHGDEILGVHPIPHARRLITSGTDGSVRIWELPSAEAVPRVRPKEGDIPITVDIHPKGTLLTTTYGDLTTKIWELPTGREIFHRKDCLCAALSPDGTKIATAGPDDARVWDVATDAEVGTRLRQAGITALAIGSDGLSAGTENGKIFVGSLRLEGTHEGGVFGLHFADRGRRLVSVGEQNFRLWDLGTGKPIGGAIPATSVLPSPTGALVAAGAEKIRLYSTSDGALVRELDREPVAGDALAFSPDERLLAASFGIRSLAVWRVSDGRRVGESILHSGPIRSAAFSPDGQFLATGDDSGNVRFWAGGASLGKPMATGFAVTMLRFTADGKHVAAAGPSGDAVLLHVDFLTDSTPAETLRFRVQTLTGLRLGADGQVEAIPARGR